MNHHKLRLGNYVIDGDDDDDGGAARGVSSHVSAIAMFKLFFSLCCDGFLRGHDLPQNMFIRRCTKTGGDACSC